MLELNAAREILLAHAPAPGRALVPLAEAGGRVLAEAVHADRAIPDCDRAIMDGYAMRSADLGPEGGELVCVGEIRAGDAWTTLIQPGMCVAIMTGAAVPPGADAVVKVEQTRSGSAPGTVVFQSGASPGQDIMPRGQDAAKGVVLLEPGTVLGPAACGLLALCGLTQVPVWAQPSVAALSTGNEIVAPEATPTAYQTRDANTAIISAMLRRHGFERPADLGIARDDPNDLRRAIAAGLGHDLLLLSGGVSMGVSDIVPDILAELGIARLFAGVAVKPGKPLWAGLRPDRPVVLAMPGNPLAVLVHSSEMVVPLLRKMSGHPTPGPPLVPAILTADVLTHTDRITAQPSRIAVAESATGPCLQATPLRMHGSADLAGAAQANGLIFLPAGRQLWGSGTEVQARVWWL